MSDLKHALAGRVWRAENEWDKRLRKVAQKGEPLEVQLKVFRPKQPHLQVLKEYPKVLSEEYWSKWEKKEYAGRGGE